MSIQPRTRYTRSGPCTRETNVSTIFAHQVANKCAVNVPVLRSSVSVYVRLGLRSVFRSFDRRGLGHGGDDQSTEGKIKQQHQYSI